VCCVCVCVLVRVTHCTRHCGHAPPGLCGPRPFPYYFQTVQELAETRTELKGASVVNQQWPSRADDDSGDTDEDAKLSTAVEVRLPTWPQATARKIWPSQTPKGIILAVRPQNQPRAHARQGSKD